MLNINRFIQYKLNKYLYVLFPQLNIVKNPNLVTHQERNMNKTARVQILVERGPFRKSTVKVGLKQRFRQQHPQLRNTGPDSTRQSHI